MLGTDYRNSAWFWHEMAMAEISSLGPNYEWQISLVVCHNLKTLMWQYSGIPHYTLKKVKHVKCPVFSHLDWHLIQCVPWCSFCSHECQFIDPSFQWHARMWMMTGQGQSFSVACLLAKTQQEFMVLWMPNLTWWPLWKTNILCSLMLALKEQKWETKRGAHSEQCETDWDAPGRK